MMPATATAELRLYRRMYFSRLLTSFLSVNFLNFLSAASSALKKEYDMPGQ